MGDPDADTAPTRTVLVIGFFTAAFTILGSLEAVVEFASLAFMVVFGAMSALALTHRNEGDINVIPPLVGTVGSAGFFVMLTWYLYAQLLSVFWLVIIIAAAVFAIEAVYFERESTEEGIQEIERQV